MCGAVVRRTLMHFHHAWHDETSHGPASTEAMASDLELDPRFAAAVRPFSGSRSARR
jgi:hypothetical protein